MATQADTASLDIREQVARIDKTLEEIGKTRAEFRKIDAEARYFPLSLAFQAMIATAALIGAGVALAKLL